MGIVPGTDDNKLNPNATITRQDMFTMLYNAMELMKMTPETYTEQFIEFADWDECDGLRAKPDTESGEAGVGERQTGLPDQLERHGHPCRVRAGDIHSAQTRRDM